ncbi:MAG: hypothetical protein ACOCQX_02045 [Candidatus Nanoarchaeia archaeon]
MKKSKFAHAGASALEKITSELALPVTAVSTTQEGNIVQRAMGGVTATAKGAYNTIEAYLTNSGVQDAVNSVVSNGLEAAGTLGNNLYEKPAETFSAALLTYAAMKLGPYVSKKVRNHYRKE